MQTESITVYHLPSGRGHRTDTSPWCVATRSGAILTTERFATRELALEHAARAAGVKL